MIEHAARADLGGGAIEVAGSSEASRGRNTIRNNQRFDVINATADKAAIPAQHNFWDHRTAAEVRATDVSGAVVVDPPANGPPSTSGVAHGEWRVYGGEPGKKSGKQFVVIAAGRGGYFSEEVSDSWWRMRCRSSRFPVAAFLSLLLLCLPAAAADRREARLRATIRDVLLIPNPLPPLAAQTHGRFEPAAGVTAERVTYGTQFGMRVPAVLYLPRPLPSSKIPSLIIVNGHGGDKYSWYAFYAGILYARAGAAVLTYDPTGEGERNGERKSGTREHDKEEPPAELARHLAGLMVTDVMQAVSYLAQRPEVNRRRVAVAGYSMGSFVVALAGALDTRVHASVLVGGGNLDGPDEYWDNSKPMCQGIPYRSLQALGDQPAVIYSLHASRGPTLIFNGLEDDTVRIPKNAASFFEDLRLRTARLTRRSDNIFDVGFEPGVGHRPFFVTEPVAAWLERQLDFPNWRAADLETMPVTHISEWARTERVELDPLYASEHREGGTRALGAGVPGLSRDDLSVFSEEEWQRQKPLLVHERWRELAKARLGR